MCGLDKPECCVTVCCVVLQLQGDSGGPVLLEASDLKVVIGVNSFGDGATCGSIRRKNAGYTADLTNPSINKWVCQFASKEELQAVARTCPASIDIVEANREVGPSPGQASKAPTSAPKDTSVPKTPTSVAPQATITAVDASGRPIRLACGPGLTCTPVTSSAEPIGARMAAVAAVVAGAVLALL
jgi:secreted trypsin-like serine protease